MSFITIILKLAGMVLYSPPFNIKDSLDKEGAPCLFIFKVNPFVRFASLKSPKRLDIKFINRLKSEDNMEFYLEIFEQ